MKANMKGLGGIKYLFLAHGEKVGIVIVGAIAVMMIFKSMSREKLPDDKGADDLQQKITAARSSMDSFTWPRAKEEFADQVRVVKKLDLKGGKVDEKAFRSETWSIPWDPSPVPPVVLRTDPVLLDPQNLEATGGSGLLAFVDPIVRRQKMLEEQQKAAKLNAEQKKQADELAKQGERGGNRARGGEQGPEAGMFDPLHPKRRPVVGMSRAAGVPLQDYEEVRTAYWALVVAQVPIKEQVKLYKDAFENARGYSPATDMPQYLGYFVERAEVRSGEEDGELKWERVSVYNGRGQRIGPAVTAEILFGKGEQGVPTKKGPAEGVVTKWVSPMPEIVDSRFLEGSSLAFPLPPLVGRDWGREVTHSEIPLAIDAVELEEDKEKVKADEAKPAEKEEPEDPFARSAQGMANAPGMGRGMEGGMGRGPMGGPGMGMGGMRGEMGGMRGGPGMMGMGRGMEGGGFGGEMGMGGGGYSGGGGFDANGEPKAPHWLLRFFDFSVEPGKKYRYRVQLVMVDPNYTVDLADLDGAVISRVRAAKKAKKSYILTEWSKPSRPVSIPLAGSVFVAGAKPPSDRANDEPKTTLLVESFGMNEGKAIQAAEEIDFARGAVANMTKDTEILVDQGRAIDPYKGFKFQTDITIADIRGGEKLTREENRPARILLMGPAGQLFVQEETEDLESVEAHRTTFAKEAKDGMGAPGFMGEGGMRGGPGMMGGRGGY